MEASCEALHSHVRQRYLGHPRYSGLHCAKQVRKTYEHYAMFVNASKDPGMCDRKLECMKVWISKLNEDAEAYYKFCMYQQQVQSLQDIIYRYNSANSTNVDEVADALSNWAQ